MGFGLVGNRGGRVTFVRPDLQPGQLAWSPSGSAIAFAVAKPGPGFLSYIAVLDLRRERVRYLRVGANPSWSPDSRKLVFDRYGAIYAMSRDGSRLSRLTP